MTELLLMGVANWFVTTLLVQGRIFDEVRVFVARGGPKLAYLVGCMLCTGTWIGLLMGVFLVPVVNIPVAGAVLTGLIVAGVGHLVLLLVNMGNAWIEAQNATAYRAAARTGSPVDAARDASGDAGGVHPRAD